MMDEWEEGQVCPYNDGCVCSEAVCHRCGWNPEVARRRTREWIRRRAASADDSHGQFA